MNICISGLTASGKTTLIKAIVKSNKLKHYSASTLLFEKLLHNNTLSAIENIKDHFWLRKQGKITFDYRLKNLVVDKEIDEKLLEIIQTENNVIIDSLSLPYLLPKNNKSIVIIYLKSKLSQRIKKAFCSSPTLSTNSIKRGIKDKDKITKNILKKIWNINILKLDKQLYDLIIDKSNFFKLVNPSDAQEEISIKIEIIQSLLNIYSSIEENDNALYKRNIEYYNFIINKYKAIILKSSAF